MERGPKKLVFLKSVKTAEGMPINSAEQVLTLLGEKIIEVQANAMRAKTEAQKDEINATVDNAVADIDAVLTGFSPNANDRKKLEDLRESYLNKKIVTVNL